MASSSSSTLGFLLILLSLLFVAMVQPGTPFVYEGFRGKEADLTFNGSIIDGSGRLKLTNRSSNIVGRAFHSKSFQMRDNSTSQNQKAYSFSTYFVFSIVPSTSAPGGHGLAFAMTPSPNVTAGCGHLLGLYTNADDSSKHIFAVEFDTVDGSDPGDSDKDANDVGVNTNGSTSEISTPAAYYEEGPNAQIKNFSMEKADAVQVWIDYDGVKKTVNVTIAPRSVSKPSRQLISSHSINLTSVLKETIYVGFSASTGDNNKASSHYILGWSFAINGPAPPLDISKLPDPPSKEKDPFPWVKVVIGFLPTLILILLFSLCSLTLYKRYSNFEPLEDWELDCPHRFKYRDLHTATKGFNESELIGVGGFGAVYRGVLPSTGTVAVKKIIRGSVHGMREFAAEIESLGRLRHKNLVNLQGWCKRKNDLLLIYDYIPNGGLDSLLFNPNQSIFLNWNQRFNIIKGIANGLLYLHEELEKVVVHRDIKTSNILIDTALNARLGDFGLARLYDHGEASHTTNVVGTIGYIAPELARTGKASTSSDVYAYGVLLLEVASGRRPIGSGQFFLVDWVVENHNLGQILEVADPKLNSTYVEGDMELVLKLGLLCARHDADSRPTMRQVMRYLNFDDPLPEIGDWRRNSDGESSRMSFGFLEIVSASSISTSHILSSSISMNSRSLEPGR